MTFSQGGSSNITSVNVAKGGSAVLTAKQTNVARVIIDPTPVQVVLTLSLIHSYRKNYTNNLQLNGFVEYEFIKGLKLKV